MIWIVLYHTDFNMGLGVLNVIKDMGFGGVDICLFASGIGCYFSLNSDSDAPRFLKRRLKRIMPTYLLFIVIWLIYKFLRNEFGWRMAIGNLFAVQNFTGLGNDFNWYIGAILLFYVLAPYLKRLTDRAALFGNLLIIVLFIVISIPFWNSTTYIVTVTRLPIFYIGMFFGKLCCQEKKMTLVYALLLCGMFIAGIAMRLMFLRFSSVGLWAYGLHWYPFILITPPLCIAISYIAYFLEKVRVLKGLVSVLSTVGNYSFEVYLLHLPLIPVTSMIIEKFGLQDVRALLWVASLICLVAGCFVLNKISGFLLSIVQKNANKC